MNKKPIIKAKSDACYKEYEDGSYIGIGLSIRQHNGIQFTQYIKHIVTGRFGSEYAELVGTIELLKRLQKIRKESIIIQGDNKGLIHIINVNLCNKKYDHKLKRFSLEFEFLYFLINRIRENGNKICFQWQPRENNRECDQLSRKKEEYTLDYELNDGEIGIYRFKAYNDIEAQKELVKYVNMRNNFIHLFNEPKVEKIIEKSIEKKIEEPVKKKQSKTTLSKMLKIFKRTGRAYA